MKGQSEINLADKLDLKDRQGIYRNFLIQSMSGRSHNLRMFSQRMPSLPFLCWESVISELLALRVQQWHLDPYRADPDPHRLDQRALSRAVQDLCMPWQHSCLSQSIMKPVCALCFISQCSQV